LADKDTYGRQPVVIVEVIQPRCSLRFGEGLCTATETPKCYNTFWTCGDTDNYNNNGSITWRFTRPGDPVDHLYEETDSNNFKTNPIPILSSVSTTSSRLTPGSSREGESPLGRRAPMNCVMENGLWDDHVGDFYLFGRSGNTAGKTPIPRGGFWDLFAVRNTFTPGFGVVLYEGYAGQTLAEMQARRFKLEQVSGPDGQGRYTIECRDPLDELRGKKALYPPTSQIDLAQDISDSATSIPVTLSLIHISEPTRPY